MTGPILFVEDDEDDKVLALEHFKSLGVATRIEWAGNGLEALDYLAKALRGKAPLPALILADIKMPKMNGLELLERVRANALLDGIPFVFLTSSGAERDRAKAECLRADAYLRKPSTKDGFADLAARILRYLD